MGLTMSQAIISTLRTCHTFPPFNVTFPTLVKVNLLGMGLILNKNKPSQITGHTIITTLICKTQ